MAAFENPVLVLSDKVTSDLSAAQFSPIVFSGGFVVAAAAGANANGFLQNKPNGTAANPATASYMVIGVSRAIASAAIAKGAKVAAAGANQVKTAVATNHVIGIAQEAAGAAGDIIPVLICLGGAPLP